MISSIPKPPHRLERLQQWMTAETVDCTIVLGADNVNHLCGYWRYFGGPSALVIGSDGERTLIVMRDEAPIASAHSDADQVLAYGERGFGIDLDPLTDLVAAVAAVPAVAQARRLGVGSELPTAVERIGAAAAGTIVGADAALHRIRLIKDWDEIEKVNAAYELCWLGQQAVSNGAAAGMSEIELFTAAQSAAQIAYGGPIEFVCDLLSGPNTAEVCCPIHVAGRRTLEAGRPRDRGRRRPCRRLLGRHRRDVRRGKRTPTRRRHARSFSTSSSRHGRSSCRERPAPRSSRTCTLGSSLRCPVASCPTTEAMRSASPRSRTRI